MASSTPPAEFVRELNHDYARVHTAKEDAFWTAYMGLAEDADAARRDFQEKEIALDRWRRDEGRLRTVRARLTEAEGAGADEDVKVALRGWVRTLEAHAIEGAESNALAEELVDLEGRLARSRETMELGYREKDGTFVEASSVKLGVMLLSEDDEDRRRAAWEGLRSIEDHVVAHGFLDVLRARNRLGRLQGAEDYYDWKTQRTEGMRKREIFALLDELEERTRDSGRRALEQLKRTHGAAAARPWNIRYRIAGDIVKRTDPYFPFAQALGRWGRSFAALGIRYRGATMVLDLVDRKGKYENGFMHGPEPTWRENGTFHRARIHFTANAIPGMVGSGKRATETLFHEGGHAAHFANVDMPAPCFAQEFAPTSVAFAETQSMFLDSLLGDADWQTRYARTEDGATMPFELIERALRETQPFAAWSLRSQFAVPYCERALYEIPDDELTAERVLEEVRAVERRLLFVDEASPRPVLSVPHLLAGEASAYYHGYILARIAVEQTRQHFLGRDGHLVDNPNIGPELRDVYWRPGNAKRFPEFVRDLTGAEVSPKALADRLNRDVGDAVAEARAEVERLRDVPEFTGEVDLDATIRVVHGHEEVATTKEGFDKAAKAFATWLR